MAAHSTDLTKTTDQTNHGNILPQQDSKPQSLTFCRELSALDVNILYSLMIARISKGYTTSEVSFLMGCKDDEIGQYEQLKFAAGMEFLFEFTEALEINSVNGIIFSDAGHAEGYTAHTLIKTVLLNDSREITEHSMYCIIQGEEHLVFKLFEHNPSHNSFSNDEIKKIRDTGTILTLMFEGSIFDNPVSSLDIYKRCRASFNANSFYPRYVQAALNEMVRKKTYPKLKLKYSKTARSTYYEKVF